MPPKPESISFDYDDRPRSVLIFLTFTRCDHGFLIDPQYLPNDFVFTSAQVMEPLLIERV